MKKLSIKALRFVLTTIHYKSPNEDLHPGNVKQEGIGQEKEGVVRVLPEVIRPTDAWRSNSREQQSVSLYLGGMLLEILFLSYSTA